MWEEPVLDFPWVGGDVVLWLEVQQESMERDEVMAVPLELGDF